jgi:Cu-processing system permease protein
MSAIAIIAGMELTSIVRRRLIPLFAVAFASIVVAIGAASGAVHEIGGSDTLQRTTFAAVPLALVLVPIVALLVGVTGHAGEPGSESFLFTQPVLRSEILVGKWLGQLLAVCGSIAVGLGAGGLLVVAQADFSFSGWRSFAGLVVSAMALGAVFLSIAALLASTIARRGTAIGAALFAWFGFVLLYDGLVIAVAQLLTGRTGARVLFTSVFGNPVDLVRLLMLAGAGTPHLLGAAGESWVRFLGGTSMAVSTSVAILLLWTIAPLFAAALVLERRDL